MGSEVFGRARVNGRGAENIESDFPDTAGTLASSSWTKETGTEIWRGVGQLPDLSRIDVPEVLDHRDLNCSLMSVTGSEVKQLQKKVGKVPRNGSGCLKRPRTTQIENQISQDEADAMKVSSDKIGLHFLKCSNAERIQGLKPRTNLNSKRSDRRNSKIPLKAKNDPFSLKAGVVSCGACPGGSTAFGMCCLKSEVHDLTKLMDEIPLKELLDGSYECPAFGKDKGKKPADMNNNILHSFRKACSVLQARGSSMRKQLDEMDICLNNKVPNLPSSSSLHVRSDISCSDVQSSEAADLSLHDKVQESTFETNAPAETSDDALLCEPKAILDRLVLPQPKDLDSLLLDASKPGQLLRCTDSRIDKPMPQQVGLPPFSWSHSYSSHCKSNSDTAKSSSRTPCQGKWIRIENPASYFGGGTICSVDLGSLIYDDSFIPSGGNKYSLPQSGIALPKSVGLPACEQGTAPARCQTASQAPAAMKMASLTCLSSSGDCGTSLHNKLNGPESSGVLTAARTLYDIANYGLKYSKSGIIKWPKQPSQKAMKACKSKLKEKPEDTLKSRSGATPDNRVSERSSSSQKKPKLAGSYNRKEIHFVTALTAPTLWAAPRASRSSPNRSSRDLVTEAKRCNDSLGKPSLMVPPPPRVVMDKTKSHTQQKVQKVVQMDWNRTNI